MTVKKLPGREDLSVTVFVPSKCKNHCAFCTSKQDYEITPCNTKAVINQIKAISKTPFVQNHVKSFVLTGGEPFADLTVLKKLIKAIPMDKKIYINTTLPTDTYTEEELVHFINTHRIDGINLSRHFDSYKKDQQFFCKEIASDAIVDKLFAPVKINALAWENANIKAYLKRWASHAHDGSVVLSFRADYRNVTPGNLKALSDPFLDKIYALKSCTYLGHGGCDVCFNVQFRYKDKLYFNYHRGLEHSSVAFGDYLLVNDILIFQDGSTAWDWQHERSE